MSKLLPLLFVVLCWSCTQSSGTEKYQKKRDHVVNIRDKVKEIEINDILISHNSNLYLINDYLIISDYHAYDELIHIFDKKNFNYITSIAYRGQGPGEIANMGHIGIDELNRIFYVTDHGKQKIFSYELDSIFTNPNYMPGEKLQIEESLFPAQYIYINDTLCMGLIVEPTGSFGFNQSVGKWNMLTGEIKPMKYVHPEIEKKRVHFAVSMKKGMYVEFYSYHDLFTLCTLHGDLIYNVYGRKWNNEKSNKTSYYGDVAFCGDKIIALYYDGLNTFYKEDSGEIRGTYPTKFIIFDTNGEYIKTLETGYRIVNFCYDEDNNRILMNMDDEIQFAYLNMETIL